MAEPWEYFLASLPYMLIPIVAFIIAKLIERKKGKLKGFKTIKTILNSEEPIGKKMEYLEILIKQATNAWNDVFSESEQIPISQLRNEIMATSNTNDILNTETFDGEPSSEANSKADAIAAAIEEVETKHEKPTRAELIEIEKEEEE